jgi:hypothetical protein
LDRRIAGARTAEREAVALSVLSYEGVNFIQQLRNALYFVDDYPRACQQRLDVGPEQIRVTTHLEQRRGPQEV